MNIVEALKTGLPMRRTGGPSFWPNGTTFTQDDILADDWEVQEPTVTITKTDLVRAWNTAGQTITRESTFDRLAAALGFK